MALLLKDGKILKIIDRTLTEIDYDKDSIRERDILSFCNMLKGMGVAFFEINSKVIKKVQSLPEGIDFIYRLESEYDAEECIRRGIKFCAVKWVKLLNPYFCNILKRGNLNITAEFKADCMSDLYRLRRLLELNKIKDADNVRIVGLDRIVSDSWVGFTRNIRRNYEVNIDICPLNSFNIATSLAVEAVMGGLEIVTLSFTGYGKKAGFAALEEVLMAIKLMTGTEKGIELDALPELSRIFSDMTGIRIRGNKAVIGSDIFKYESGIHADGIEKAPATYEPFNPYEVGQERKLIIGKHSGRRSVLRKLKELGQDFDEAEIPSVLNKVRTKSIELKRELYDQEIKDILVTNKAV